MIARSLLILLLCFAASSAGASDLFAYLDEEGELVVADSPLDDRYRRYVPGEGFVRRNAPSTTDSRKRRHSVGEAERRIDPELRAAAKAHKISYPLLKAVAAVESQFNPKARSRAGAMGIMQLMPDTARSLNVKNAFDPAENIDGGARYLARLLKRFGRTDLALAAYNAGPTRVERAKGIPNIRETRNYVRDVMRLAEDYR